MTSADALIGAELGDFRPLRLLGKGGMGVVYEAEDLALPRTVALKVLAPHLVEDSTARGRFQREIDHAVKIEHPNVVPVYTAGFERPHFFIAMRLVRGAELGVVLDAHTALPEARALRLVGQVASALASMHDSGLVHRDIKPQNVLIWDAGGDDEHAMVTDFGIAKALDPVLSTTGIGPLGTPGYMAPEVCLGQAATPASDQYALACMAFEMLAGSLPFQGDSVLALREAQVEQPVPSLRGIVADVDARSADAIEQALQKRPEQRHPNVRAFVAALGGARVAFGRSESVRRTFACSKAPEERVARLSTEHGLSDVAISRLTDLDRTEVVRMRRRRARRALAGRR
jgi:serine/threonine-protein kinase